MRGLHRLSKDSGRVLYSQLLHERQCHGFVGPLTEIQCEFPAVQTINVKVKIPFFKLPAITAAVPQGLMSRALFLAHVSELHSWWSALPCFRLT